MLASLDITLRRFPALQSFEHTTRAIATFLGPPPNLLLSEACERGSIATLDWIWTASCTSAEDRTPRWTFTNYLRSDPLYYRWQFAKSLYAAAERGDMEIVEWLFAHFSGCEAPMDIVCIAKEQGNLLVLRFLWEHRSIERKVAAQTERLPRGDAGGASDCMVQFHGFHNGERWGETAIKKAVENGQLAQCLDDGMEMDRYDRVTAITEALRLGNVELAERLVPVGESILQYATDCAQPEVIENVLSEGYLQWDEEHAAFAFKNLAEVGRCEVMQQIFQLHSPLQEDHSRWKNAWREAFKAACSGGNLTVLKWLMEHHLRSEVCDEMKRNEHERGISIKSYMNAATEVFDTAATKGHVEVLQFLYEKGIASVSPFTERNVIQQIQLNAVKWLVDHGVIEDRKTFSWAIGYAAQYGRLDILQLFQTLDKPGGYEAVGLKRRRTGPEVSLWSGDRDTTYCAAGGGHVDVLEWLQANYPAEWDAGAMDAAAYEGHLDAVKWLHANRTEGCTIDAFYMAAEEDHYEVVKWLYDNRPESRTCAAIFSAFRSGNLRIAYWLHFKFPDCKLSEHSEEQRLLWVFWFRGKPLEALFFLRAIYPSIFTETFVEQVREDCARVRQEHLFTARLALRWLDDNYPTTTATEESSAAEIEGILPSRTT